MPAATRSGVSEAVHDTVPAIFQQAQHSVASHKKNVVQLHKIQLQAAAYTEPTPKGPRLVGERTFNNQFLDVLKNILPLKKGTTVADRIVKFVGAFVHFIVEKVPEEKQKQNETVADEDSPAERFIEDLLKLLLKGSSAKDKHVRYRSVQLIAEVVSSIGELDDDLYADLRSSLLERVQDKEASVRTQAVIALSKLQRGEESIEMGSDEVPLVEVLAEVLQLDPSAEVRKAVALNIPRTDLTIHALVSRTRDVDDAVRRVIYHHCLPQIPLPRYFSIAQREQILRNGLGDRDESVRASAAKLIGQWVDLFNGNLLEYLDTFELVSGTKVAEDALKALFNHRPDVLDSIKFEDSYWTELLTPEKAFLVRVFADHCVATKDEARMESTLPVVTTLAFRIQLAYNHLIECHQRHDDESNPFDERRTAEDEILDYEFVVGELFKLALNMDYADEIGRRKMFGLVGEMVRQEALPESLIPGCLDILAKLSPSERDFIRLMVENIQSMRDVGVNVDEEMPPADDETVLGDTPARRLFAPPPDKTDEEKARIATLDHRCLTLCIGMLERVQGTFDENPTLEAILREHVFPAVQSKEVVVRGRGLTALGLCCTIHKKMALGSFPLFAGQAEKATLSLRVKSLQTMFDMMMLYPNDLLYAKNGEQTQEDQIIEFLAGILQESAAETQTVICAGFAKLMLAGIITNPLILRTLVILYFAPETLSNQELRQSLTYFFPVYCYSSSVNQRRMLEILLPVYEFLLDAYSNLSEGEEMITPDLLLGHLVDWTDPEKVIVVGNMPRDEEVHLDLAIQLVRALFDAGVQAADKKLFCQTLSRLYLPDDADENKLRSLKFLMNSFKQKRRFPDATTKNAFERFSKLLEKKYTEQLKSMTEEECREMVELKELFDFLDEICPEETVEETAPKKRVTRARKSDEATAKKRSKRKRGDITETEDETSTQASVASASPPARRPKSTRAAANRARTRSVSVGVTDMDSVDTEMEDLDDESSDEAPKHKPPKRRRQEPETAEEIDADIEMILSGKGRGTPVATRLHFGTVGDRDSDVGSEADITVRPGGGDGDDDDDDSEGEVAQDLLDTDGE